MHPLITTKFQDNVKFLEAYIELEPFIVLSEKIEKIFQGFISKSVHTGWHPSDVCLTINVEVDSKRELLTLLKYVASEGLKQTRAKFEYAADNTITYHYGRMSLCIRLGANSACKFVEVGKKEPEPLFEIQCDGERIEDGQ